MIVMEVTIKNCYQFKDSNISFSYPRRNKNPTIEFEYLEDYKNFRFKKINILMGANASGKTSFGRVLMGVFNFISKGTEIFLTKMANSNHETNSSIDIYYVVDDKLFNFYVKFNSIEIKESKLKKIKISKNDSYESCREKLDSSNETDALKDDDISFGWFFSFTEKREVSDEINIDVNILEKVLMSFDRSIKNVTKILDADNSFRIEFHNGDILLMQNGQVIDRSRLSSGTLESLNIASILSELSIERPYFIDEKISHSHSELEICIVNLLIGMSSKRTQIFYTTHNNDLLEMNIPIHSFTFFKNTDYIEIIDPSKNFKKNDRSLMFAVKNDIFKTLPDTSMLDDLLT